MFRGLYTVTTALEQSNKKIDVISNNLANVNTTGYKEDISISEEFRSLLLYRLGGDYKTRSNEKTDVKVESKNGVYTLNTNNGFFRVAATDGVSYNTSLRFIRGGDGYLRTFHRNVNGDIIEDSGFKVIGKNGFIKLDNENFEIDKYGNILVDSKAVDSLLDFPVGSIIGTMSGGSKVVKTAIDFTEGDLMQTNNALDLAILGRGFFKVKDDRGTFYTRDGSFKLSADRKLVTDNGARVQGISGDIVLPTSEIGINEFGEFAYDGGLIDKLLIVEPKKPEYLKKLGNNMYSYTKELTEDDVVKDAKIRQGFLEGSNVNPVKEMIKMIETYRGYESAQRVIRAYDEIASKSVNDIGRV